jgi:hypothetical protein
LAALLAVWFEGAASAADTAKLVFPSKGAEKQVAGLSWDSLEVDVFWREEGLGVKTIAMLKGAFTKQDWSLIWDKKLIAMGHKEGGGKFEYPMPLRGKTTEIELLLISPEGDIARQEFVIQYEGWGDRKTLGKTEARTVKSGSLVVGAGISHISYTETNKPDLSQFALTAKAAYTSLAFPPNWDFGMSAYATLVPFLASGPSSAARFLGLNLRFGYSVPSIKEPWRLSLLGGVYYTTMMVSSKEYGYANVAGPQFYPVVRRIAANGETLAGYLKFSPVSSGFSVLNLSSREIAAGASWSRPRAGGGMISYSIDLADIELDIESKGKVGHSRSITLGVGYAF